MANLNTQPLVANGGTITEIENGWRLEIPAGEKGSYRLAQLDDYADLSRKQFPWQPGISLSLEARASHQTIPGTWGFGLWNDPFSLSLGFGGGMRRLPAPPNAAWFFFASPPNYLSLRDDIPAQGALAATFRSRPLPAPLLALASPALPFMAWPPTTRLVRRLARAFIRQDAHQLDMDVTDWHSYSLHWREQQVQFEVNGQSVFQTAIAPYRPLGFVLWIDNQYAALPPNGKLGFGTLKNQEPAWIEVRLLEVNVG
ncbi:MAG: hypothetical protein HND51_09110 [Chloroflexi bacterium]|nr:hypothetical protein [Chloroflexota bacterium]NOH11791.1 hypothetical protein [Chloroflexota bacterium]